MSHRGPLSASLVASAAVHALLIGFLAVVVEPRVRPALVIPVSLVSLSGGGGGGAAAPEPPAPVAAAEVPPPPQVVAQPVHPRPSVRPRPVPVPAAPAPIAAVGGPGAGGIGAEQGGVGPGAGTGDGEGGGDGSGGARVAYGMNPLPPYPLVARRLGREGVVLLEVLVAPDGHPADVRVIRSCGFAPLDESAATTVRERWRFIPARQGATPVESRVTVPIRFRLDARDDVGTQG